MKTSAGTKKSQSKKKSNKATGKKKRSVKRAAAKNKISNTAPLETYPNVRGLG